jgi:signal transduction histidine kinase
VIAVDPLRVLYVEDSPADQELTRRALARQAPHLALQTVSTVTEAVVEVARGDVDLVLSDYRLPDGTGLDLLQAITAHGWLVPVVLVTGSGDPEAAMRLLKAGAADYVVKRRGYLDTLPSVLEGAFRWFQSVRELRQTPRRVLYAEHDPTDIELTRRAFREAASHVELEIALSGRAALERLRAASYDLLLLDYRIPDVLGIEVLKAMREERLRVPVVMVTGQGDEATAVQAFKLGVADYVIKRDGYLAKLPSTVENVLAQRRLADEKEALLVLNGLTTSIASLRSIEEIVGRVTRATADLFGAEVSVLWLARAPVLTPAAAIGLDDAVLPHLTVDTTGREAALARGPLTLETLWPSPDTLPASAAVLAQQNRALAAPLRAGSELLGLLAVASRRPRTLGGTDERLLRILADHAAIAIENARLYGELQARLDELRRAQGQLVQSEKLAAIGELAGGVAHDFNNLLTVILGHTGLMRERWGEDPSVGHELELIEATASRAARLTQQLLAFSRRQTLQPRVLDVGDVVARLEPMLRRLIPENVVLAVHRPATLGRVRVDPSQLEQVILNLVVNARDAMPGGGHLTIDLADQWLNETPGGQAALRPGPWVTVAVQDTGIGMDAATQARIFEPFFTTKAPDKGTGLGLATVYGVVKQSGGHVEVSSEPGRGTTFRLYFPGVDDVPEADEPVRLPGPPARGQETILLVEDEESLRELGREILEAYGYVVFAARHGAEALLVAERHAGPFHLVLTDMIMPEMSGRDLVGRLTTVRPAIRVLFMSAYPDTVGGPPEGLPPGTAFLQKPFAPETLARKVREVLDGR